MKWALVVAALLLIFCLLRSLEGYDEADDDYKTKVFFLFYKYGNGSPVSLDDMSPEELNVFTSEFVNIYNGHIQKKGGVLITQEDLLGYFPMNWLNDYNRLITE